MNDKVQFYASLAPFHDKTPQQTIAGLVHVLKEKDRLLNKNNDMLARYKRLCDDYARDMEEYSRLTARNRRYHTASLVMFFLSGLLLGYTLHSWVG